MGRLKVKDLNIQLGDKKVLTGVTMDVWDGHIHAIVGPNGAGKSTLASIIMGRDGYGHYEGDITFEGKPLRDVPTHERARMGITYSWQEPARFEGLTIKALLRAGAKDKSRKAIENALETVGLDPDEYMERAVDKTLSGGERKKVELASILVMEPKLVLLDEPDSGIDVASLNKIFDVIHILKEKGTTVILITHSEHVLEQAEHAFLLCNGKLINKGIQEQVSTFFMDMCNICDHKNEPNIEEMLEAANA